MSTNVYVAGVGSTKFGVLPGRNLQSLAAEAARAALADSDIPPARIGCVFVGNFVGGIMTGQELLGPIVAADLGLSNVAAIKIEAACASSSAAARIGHDLIRAGAEDAVLVIGVERLTGAPRDALTTAMTAAIDQGTEGRSRAYVSRFLGHGDGPPHAPLRHHARAGRRGDGEKPEVRRGQSAGAIPKAGHV